MQNPDCNKVRYDKGQPVPRTCKVCGLGPCKYDPPRFEEEMPMAIVISHMESPDKLNWCIRIGKTTTGRAMAEISCDGKIIARKVIDPKALEMGAMLIGYKPQMP